MSEMIINKSKKNSILGYLKRGLKKKKTGPLNDFCSRSPAQKVNKISRYASVIYTLKGHDV